MKVHSTVEVNEAWSDLIGLVLWPAAVSGFYWNSDKEDTAGQYVPAEELCKVAIVVAAKRNAVVLCYERQRLIIEAGPEGDFVELALQLKRMFIEGRPPFHLSTRICERCGKDALHRDKRPMPGIRPEGYGYVCIHCCDVLDQEAARERERPQLAKTRDGGVLVGLHDVLLRALRIAKENDGDCQQCTVSHVRRNDEYNTSCGICRNMAKLQALVDDQLSAAIEVQPERAVYVPTCDDCASFQEAGICSRPVEEYKRRPDLCGQFNAIMGERCAYCQELLHVPIWSWAHTVTINGVSRAGVCCDDQCKLEFEERQRGGQRDDEG